MEFNQLNVQQICSVRSRLNCYSTAYLYKKAKRILFFWRRKEGFYFMRTISSPYIVTKEDIEKDGKLFCAKDKNGEETVFFKPHLEIRMSNGNIYEKYFETEEALIQFMNSDVMKSVNWINR